MEKKKQKDKVELRDFAPAAAVGTGTLLAAKAHSDMNKILTKGIAWQESMVPHAQIAASKPQLTVTEAADAIDTYIKGGRNVARSTVLGIPGGKIMQGFHAVHNAPTLVKGMFGAGDPGKVQAAKKAIEHYKFFTDKKISLNEARGHMLEKGITHDFSHQWNNSEVFTPQIKELIHSKDLTIPEKLTVLREQGPSTSKALEYTEKGLLGTSGHRTQIGEGVRVSGNQRQAISLPEVYMSNLEPTIKKWAPRTKFLAGAGALATAALTTIPFINQKLHNVETQAVQNYKKKEAQKKERVREDLSTAAGATVAAGGALAAVEGTKRTLNPSKTIGITYGTMPWIGQGHSSPGKAIKSLLEEDARFKDYKIETLERDSHGIFRSPTKRYNTIIDTGLGAYTIDPNNPWFDPTKATHHYNLPRTFKTEGVLRYQTDMVDSSLQRGSAAFGRKHDKAGKNIILSYGPHTKEKFKLDDPKARIHQVSEHMAPALNKQVVTQNAFPPTSEQTLAGLMNSVEESQKASIQGLRGKKLLTVSGSGRGDYVALRARELHDALKAHNLHNEYSVVALMAGAKGSEQEKLLHGTSVVSLGKLPQKEYNAIQGISHINWGSTGTSNIGESLAQRNVQAIPEHWGATPGKVTPGGIAHRQETKLKELGVNWNDHQYMDDWNRGNIEYALKQPGMLKAQTAEDIVGVLKDPKKYQELADASVTRSQQQYMNFLEGTGKLKDVIHGYVKSNTRKARLKGLGLAAVGASAIAYGASKLKPQKVDMNR